MALRGTATHRKIRRLGRRLNIDPCFALGVMELIWHTTAEQQPDGGIGRLSDEDIAEELMYSGDPTELVTALIAERLLDKIDGCRLYVHDWHDWADDAVISKLVSRTLCFANGEVPRLTKYSIKAREEIRARYAQSDVDMRSMRTVRTTPTTRVPVPVPEPVPEPEPVPVPEAPRVAATQAHTNGKNGKSIQPTLSEDAVLFRSTCEEYGMHCGEEEWINFFTWHWDKGSLEKKLAAIDGLRQRIAAGDKSLIDTVPRNYFNLAMWGRNIRAPAASERRRPLRDPLKELENL